jgi:lipopolysaccharide/colanic/teichoic acid biosynthesis glycosyltransferase
MDIRKVEHKYLESFEIWCWRRMEKISRADHVTNEAVLQRVEEVGNILQIVQMGRLPGFITSCVETAF